MGVYGWSLFCCAQLSFYIVLQLSRLEKKIAGCLTLIAFSLSYDSLCSVSLPHGAVGWSTVCDCGVIAG